eukprot:Skav234062  [mRNA]  locus=scaffold619:225192:228532:+ [translate_table: standard]
MLHRARASWVQPPFLDCLAMLAFAKASTSSLLVEEVRKPILKARLAFLTQCHHLRLMICIIHLVQETKEVGNNPQDSTGESQKAA